jgi:hypothetical protein
MREWYFMPRRAREKGESEIYHAMLKGIKIIR